MTTLAFVLQSPDVTPTWLSRFAAAIAVHLARDVAPMWLLGWPEVDTRVYERIPDASRGSFPLVLLGTTPPEAARSPAQRHPASRMARRQRRLRDDAGGPHRGVDRDDRVNV